VPHHDNHKNNPNQTRTTAAVTNVSAGVADNVLPQQGIISINFRLLPGDTPQQLLEYLERVIGPRCVAGWPPACGLVGWLVGGWVGGWVGWLVGWWVGWLVGWLQAC